MRRSLRVIARRRTVALILIVGLAAGSAGTGAAHAGAQVGDGPNRPPVVSFVSPAANQAFRSIDSILLSANASDDRGVARVEFRLDGNLVEAAQSPSTNPYQGARVYVDPEWRAKALAEPGGDRVADQPTAVWLDSIAAIRAGATGMGLAEHLDRAVIQAAGRPLVVQIVIYNLPGRNCGRTASDGELAAGDLPRYKAEFIDPIAEILGRPAYANLRIVTVIEPDSLPNLIVNTGARSTATPLCDTMLANGGYVHGVGYALARLGALPNVFNYLDVSHHGVIGWEEDLAPTVDLLAQAARASGSTMANVRGFVTNTANYSALREPFIPMTDPYRTSKWVDFNQFNDELTFAQAMRIRLVEADFDPGVGFLVDTSRNGWGGPTRPLGPSTSTETNTFVDQSRIDRRIVKRNYCNQTGAGLGERPTAAPAEGIHAYAWIKPPGESDGPSLVINDAAFDRMCDPTYLGPPFGSGTRTGALAGAPAAGAWFPAQFQQLMRNAYPPL
jgi:cellulose 1,4-beta-cellobiosidase